MDSKKILGIDTCMGACSVAVYDPVSGGSHACSEMIQYGHAERLMPMMQEVMEQVQALPENIGLVAVTKGPGAFTGMRAGISAAKAYAMALGMPVSGVCSFNALLETYRKKPDFQESPYYAVAIDTRRDDFYFQMYDAVFMPVSEPECLSAVQIIEKVGLQDIVFIGDACAQLLAQMTHIKRTYRMYDIIAADPVCVARLGTVLDIQKDFSPVYLRAPDVSIAKNAGKA